jgi:heterodisulfide reductase subunit A
VKERQPHVIVVGAGIAGMSVASAAANAGMNVTLVERDSQLGGHAAHWACMATDECARCSACVAQEQIRQVSAHPGIEILLGATLSGCEGEASHFRVLLEPEPISQKSTSAWNHNVLRETRLRICDAVVLAAGFKPYDPSKDPLLGYGHFDGVVTTRDLDRLLREDDLARFVPENGDPIRVAFIQCVGSRGRKSGREYCSQFCCRTTIRLVQRLRYLCPSLEATVFYIDLQIMKKEFGVFFDRVREHVRFIQGVPAEVCRGDQQGVLRVYSVAPGANRTQAFEFDRVVLAIGMAPADSHRALAEVIGLDLNELGYFAANGPAETSRPGVFVAGACRGPTDIQGARRQGLAVAGVLARKFAANADPSTESRPEMAIT